MKKVLAMAAFVLGSLVFGPLARADSLAATFARGNRAFSQADYHAAIAEYERLLSAGVDDPAVTFNLASAYGSIGRYGQAIRYFEHTLLLSPGDEAAEKALAETRRALGERTAQLTGEAIVAERPPLSEALFAWLSSDALALSFLLAVWLSSLSALALFCSRADPRASTLRVRSEGARLALGITCGGATLLAAVCGFGLGTRVDWGRSEAKAVVIVPAATLREGPDLGALVKSELAEGTPARILSRDGAYVRIQSGSLDGYVLGSEVGEI